MSYRNGTYTAFYVDEPFIDGSSSVTEFDFCYFNLLKAWKSKDESFPFIDSHQKTYQVRDGSDFETTLVPRIRERLRNSKNIILFLSSHTKPSRALLEEIQYGSIELRLPIIIVYPEFETNAEIHTNGQLNSKTNMLIDKIPCLRKAMNIVPTAHILMNKNNISACINFSKLSVLTAEDTFIYTYKD